MKKVFISIFIMAVLCTGVFAAAAKRPNLEPIESEIYSFEDGIFEYTNLPQFEMMAIACRIAGIEGFTWNYNGGYAYLDQIDSMKDKYKNHKLIKLLQAANKKGVTNGGFANLAYFVKPDFSGTTCDLDPKPVNLNWEWQKVSGKEIYAIVSALHDFAAETPFMRFRNLYRADYITSIQATNDWVNKYKVKEWYKDFFGYEMPVTINYSAIVVGNTFYDFTTGEDGKEKYYVTTFTNAYLVNVLQCYIMCYTQKYADSVWDDVKDIYINYMKAYNKRIDPDNYDPKRFDTFSSFNLAGLCSSYFILEFAGYALEEESPGIYEESKNAFYKSVQDENMMKVFELIDEYKSNRDKYLTIDDFYEKMTAFIKTLPLEN